MEMICFIVSYHVSYTSRRALSHDIAVVITVNKYRRDWHLCALDKTMRLIKRQTDTLTPWLSSSVTNRRHMPTYVCLHAHTQTCKVVHGLARCN